MSDDFEISYYKIIFKLENEDGVYVITFHDKDRLVVRGHIIPDWKIGDRIRINYKKETL